MSNEVGLLRERLAAERADAARYRFLVEHRRGWFSRFAPTGDPIDRRRTAKSCLDEALDREARALAQELAHG